MTLPSPPKEIQGKHAIVAVLLLGLAGAGGGWWYHQRLQRRPLAFWGSGVAELILRAPEVEFCRLSKASPNTSSPNVMVVNGKAYEPTACRDAARLPGFLHLRHSLLSDDSFDWNDATTAEHDWRYALRFRDGPKAAVLLVSADFNYFLSVERGVSACGKPIARGVEQAFSGASL